MTEQGRGEPWWRHLRNPGDRALPGSVVERMRFYGRQMRQQRQANYALEGSAVIIAAGIPAAAALGASVALMGVLGAIVAILAGLRQLLRPGENWIRTSGAMVAIQREAVLWSAGADPYAGPDADVVLVSRVEDLVGQETAGWAALRAPKEDPVAARPAPLP
jgi:hypothetical protein